MQLKILKDWQIHTGESLDNIYDYIGSNINPEDVYLMGDFIFFPKIIEYKGGYFLYERILTNQYDIWVKKLNDIIEIEKIVNHVHIYDLFENFSIDVDDNVFLKIGLQMKLSWELFLKHTFPLKEFIVDFNDGENDYGPTITFYQNTSLAVHSMIKKK